MRPRTQSVEQARAVWRAARVRLKRAPTADEYARVLGVSERTAYRYMRRLEVARVCQHCDGKGYL